MALKLIHVAGQPVAFVTLSLFLCWMCPSTNAEDYYDIIDVDSPELKCSEGLRNCKVSSVSPYEAALPDPEGPVNVTHVALKVVLCCSNKIHCVPCLQIVITILDVVDDLEESGDSTEESFGKKLSAGGSGLHAFHEALVKVCFSSPGSGDHCKTLQFTYSDLNVAAQDVTHEFLQLLLKEKEMYTYGSPVLVRVLTHSVREYSQNITIPSLKKVCSMSPEVKVKECDAPMLQVETDIKTNVARLKVENRTEKEGTFICQMVWDGTPGEMLLLPKDQKDIWISLNSVAPCLCFQVWWEEKMLRREYCPFKNQQVALERMQHSVSLTLVESSPVRGGGSVLVWNVSSPCRLKADLWLCKREVAEGRCQEVTGSRQRLDRHAGWSTTGKGHWKIGEFSLSPHPLLCLQIQLDGIQSHLDPHCPFAASRWRWTFLLLTGLLLVCVSILGAYCIKGVLKGYAWRWFKDDEVKGAVGGGHVVLLYPPDDEQALPGLMCHLGSSLQALGCSVSLDLWSHAELSVLGPVPWLHSRLDRLQRQGGKVVLVLTQAARKKAEEWGARSWERITPSLRDKDMETGIPSTCVDVFSASLSCILADYLQGRAGERFMLVQFESLPPEPPGGCLPLPELFRGLHVYSLPSQSLGFLTELAGTQQMINASSRRKRAHGLRMASRALARGLSGFTAGTAVLRLAAMPQSCVGTQEEDTGETMPLQPYLITPPSSPDTNPKLSETEWI